MTPLRSSQRSQSAPSGMVVRLPPGRTRAEILRGAVEGESWAYAALYQALYPVVARALQKILHQSSDYEDLVQISFELIVRTLKKSRDKPIENLAAWSSAIAARVALDSIRARIRERQFLERDAGEAFENLPGAPLDRELDVRSELAWLQGMLGSMKREQAEAVLLHDVLGHDLWEIASLTGTTPMAAQKRLSRGHLELKKRAAKRETAKGR